MKRYRVGLVVLALQTSPWLAGSSSALNLEQCISADGHVYVIASTSTSMIGTRITSVAIAEGISGACVTGGSRNQAMMTFAASDGQPLADRVRTTVLSGFTSNSISCMQNFDPNGAGGKGVLYLPSPGDRTVSVDAAESSEELVPVIEADERIPAAVDRRLTASGKHGRCRGIATTFPAQDDRLNGADGFLLQGNCSDPSTCQLVVFVGYLGEGGCAAQASASISGMAVDGSLNNLGPEASLRAAGSHDCAQPAYAAPSFVSQPAIESLRGLPMAAKFTR